VGNDVLFALGLTFLAGLGTAIGGLIGLFSKPSNKKFLTACLAFSAGVMLYISFAEVLLHAFEDLEYVFEDGVGIAFATIAFFVGIGLMMIIDKFMHPEDDVADILDSIESPEARKKAEKKKLHRTGVSSAFAIAIHNLPEGVLVFLGAMADPALGIGIAIAIAMHNIPEGIAVSAPIYHATGSRKRGFLVSLASGLTEPLGGLLAWLVLSNLFNEDAMSAVFGITFALVAGIMVYVSVHHLLPTAQRYGKHHTVMKWLFAGMAFIAATIVLIELFI